MTPRAAKSVNAVSAKKKTPNKKVTGASKVRTAKTYSPRRLAQSRGSRGRMEDPRVSFATVVESEFGKEAPKLKEVPNESSVDVFSKESLEAVGEQVNRFDQARQRARSRAGRSFFD